MYEGKMLGILALSSSTGIYYFLSFFLFILFLFFRRAICIFRFSIQVFIPYFLLFCFIITSIPFRQYSMKGFVLASRRDCVDCCCKQCNSYYLHFIIPRSKLQPVYTYLCILYVSYGECSICIGKLVIYIVIVPT